MTPAELAAEAIRTWYDNLPRTKGSPARGSLAVALVVLERLKKTFDLRLESHLAKGEAQIREVSTPNVRRILAARGETRDFLREAGRTNRGGPAVARNLLDSLQPCNLSTCDPEERKKVLDDLQHFVVEKVRELLNRERLKPEYDPSKSTRQFIRELLALAEATGKWGPVAQYLVGAKLQLRFPGIEVRNESSSAADQPSKQPGDFVVGDTAFHVTVSPTQSHYDKCKQNLGGGRRVFLLVPDALVVGTRQNVEQIAAGRIAVEAIESFVGQNMEELSGFKSTDLRTQLRQLLETYNTRVDAVETDKSMMIEIPAPLGHSQGGKR